MPRRALSALGAVVVAVLLAGCAATVSMTPAADANDPACAGVVARLPELVNGFERRHTDAQATGAWGDPARILLTCGVAVPSASALPCRTVSGVDWLVDDSADPQFRFTTFGRSPAVEVYLEYDEDVDAFDALTDLSVAVGTLPTTGSVCTDRPTG